MAYTPTVYTNDASSPDLDATNLNKSEQGIKLAHDIAVPVDNTSRVAEYTGAGIPLIPDNVAGRTYFQDEWATTDGWTSYQGTLSVTPEGQLKSVATVEGPFTLQRIMSFTGKVLIIKIKGPVGSNGYIKVNTTIIKQSFVYNGSWQYFAVYASEAVTSISLTREGGSPLAIGDVLLLDFIYIGTGAYDTPALDRAGNGNSLALNAVTPVNGKYGKEMSFNGFTSYGVDKSPVVGISGTLIMRWKRNRIGTAETIISNQSATTDGLRYHIDASNNLYVIIGGATPVSILIKSGFTDTASSHTFGIRFSATSATPFYDGVDGTAVPATQVPGLANFAIGRNQIDSTGYASGKGVFRYDSRIWTADEARAWSLNPISIDSRV